MVYDIIAHYNNAWKAQRNGTTQYIILQLILHCSEKNTHLYFVAQLLERVTNLNKNLRENS